MDQEYIDAKQITIGVVGLYLKLAELEKQGKKESQEYNNFLFLLKKAVEIEERKYFSLISKETYLEDCKKVFYNAQKLENTLLVPHKEILVALRMLNYLDQKMHYSLFTCTSTNMQVYSYLEDIFLQELFVYKNVLDGVEKETIIDYIYAILVSSCLLTIDDLSFSLFKSLSYEDRMIIKMDLLPKIEVLNADLFAFTDEHITKETIILILFLKACLYFHPYRRNVIEENKNALNLKKEFSDISGQNCSEICKLLSLLDEEKVNRDYSRK